MIFRKTGLPDKSHSCLSEVLFEKHDKSKTGKLDQEELRSLLVDLSGGLCRCVKHQAPTYPISVV